MAVFSVGIGQNRRRYTTRAQGLKDSITVTDDKTGAAPRHSVAAAPGSAWWSAHYWPPSITATRSSTGLDADSLLKILPSPTWCPTASRPGLGAGGQGGSQLSSGGSATAFSSTGDGANLRDPG